MQQITVRKITTADIIELQNIGKLTFAETFSSENSETNMKEYLENGFSTEKLTEELTDPNAEFYFAELDGKTIGYLKINVGQSQTEIKDKNALEIERIYVLKEFHGKKSDKFFMTKPLNWRKIKMWNMFGWEFGNKTQEPSDFIKKMDLWHSTNTFSNSEMTNKPT